MDIETLIAESLNLKSQPKAKSFVRTDASKNTASQGENGFAGPTHQPSVKAVSWRDNIDHIHQLFAQIEPSHKDPDDEDDEFGDFQAINNNDATLDVGSDDFGEFISIEISNNNEQVRSHSIPSHMESFNCNKLNTTTTTCEIPSYHNPPIHTAQNGQISHFVSKNEPTNCVANGNLVNNNLKLLFAPKGMQWDEVSSSSISDITSVQSLEFMAPNLKIFNRSSIPKIEDKMNDQPPKHQLKDVAQDTSLPSNTKLFASREISTITSSNDFLEVKAAALSSPNASEPNYFAIRDEIPYPSFDVWLKILEKCKYYVDSFVSKLLAIDTCAIKILISAQPFVDYLNDLNELYAIAHRIRLSFNLLSIQSTPIQLLLDELSSTYNNLCSMLDSNPESSVLDTIYVGSTNSYKLASIESIYCNLCYLQAYPDENDNKQGLGKGIGQKFAHNFTWKIVEYDGKNYHLSCLNYWLQIMET